MKEKKKRENHIQHQSRGKIELPQEVVFWKTHVHTETGASFFSHSLDCWVHKIDKAVKKQLDWLSNFVDPMHS